MLIIIVAIAAFFFYAKGDLYASLDSSNNETTVITVKPGESAQEIGEDLMSQRIIKSGVVFQAYAKYRHLTFVPGMYKFSPSMSAIEIAGKLVDGDIAYNKVLFQEGLRREQMAQVLYKNGYTDYNSFMTKTADIEGKLFPDTYYFPLDASTDYIIDKIKKNYEKKVAGLNLTQNDLILASIVEREAGNDTDRPIIAGIFQNRLDAGMMLQSDPTSLYQKDTNNYSLSSMMDYKFWHDLLPSEIKGSKGPFNTYLNVGLPKGPIANPGLASIRAAMNPTKDNYYYFIYGTDGNFYPAKNVAEHNSNIAKYLQ